MDSLSDKIIYTGNFPYDVEPGGLGKTFFTKMSSYGDAIAQVHGYTKETDTYSALLQRCVRTAITMRKKGILPGDIISICSHNHFNSSVPFIASLFLGVIPASLDPSLSLADTTYLIGQVKPKIIFVSPEAVELIENSTRDGGIKTEIVVFGESAKHLEFSKFIKAADEEKSFEPVEADLKSTAMIGFSSGTSGFPKGVCLPHYGLLCQALRSRDIDYDAAGYLGFASLYWQSSIYILNTCILYKRFRVIVPKFDVNTIWDVLSTVKVSSLFLATYHATLLSAKRRPEGVTTNIKTVLVGGTYVSEQLMNALEAILPEAKIFCTYGITELCGTCFLFDQHSSADEELRIRKPTSVGRAPKGFAFKVVDPNTEEILGPNQKGELRIKTNIQLNGYYNTDSSFVWDSSGWFKTGDIAYYDDDKCFYIVDRLKEMLRVRSWNVSPIFVEEILMSNPYVEVAVVVGLPHPIDGEHPVAVVVLKEGAKGKVNPEDFVKYVDARVDDPKRLRGGVKIVDSIPITPSGKVNRQLIKKLIMQGSV